MIRSGSFATAASWSPQAMGSGWHRTAMLRQQLRGRIGIKVDPERLSGSLDNSAPVLVNKLSSNPLPHSFCLSSGQGRLTRGTLQCRLQAAGRPLMEPAIDAAWLEADERGDGFDWNAIP